MPDTPVKAAPESSLPEILVNPPWVRFPPRSEPVITGLKVPKDPATIAWAPGQREEWLRAPYGKYGCKRLPEDTDWAELAAYFESGRALPDAAGKECRSLMNALLMQAPLELGERFLADERYRDALGGHPTETIVQGAVARHGLAAYPLALHAAKNNRRFPWMEPYFSADTAQLMIRSFGEWPNDSSAAAWFRLHGTAAARLTVPDALRRPGPKRRRAEAALRLVAGEYGTDAVMAAAQYYGDEVERAISALRFDPLDRYPEPLPEPGERLAPENLPPILLRGRESALPDSAVRHLVTMVLISGPHEPWAGLPQVIEVCDPDSLAEFAWAMYRADDTPKVWTAYGIQGLLKLVGNDETADRLAPIVAAWPKWLVWEYGGTSAIDVFSAIGTDNALRHLHRLGRKAKDVKRIRPWAAGRLERIAEDRGLTAEQLADRLVPDFGLDAEGGLTLDYGRRTFRVGFDEQLKPYVTDEDGKVRKTLPKPGVRDDEELAPAAHQRFAALKKEVRTVASDQIKRLEKAMVAGRGWTAEEFTSLFVRHPLMWHIARRLVWSTGTATFRIAEDRTLAGVDDDTFALPGDARVTLPHPLHLGEELKAWSDVLADYGILQPFPQLGRTVHALTDQERGSDRLARFEGLTVHFGRIMSLPGRGWELGEKEDGGFRRQALLQLAEDRWLEVDVSPGIRVIAPEEFPDQDIHRVVLSERRYGRAIPFGALDPVAASEAIAELTRLTGSTTS